MRQIRKCLDDFPQGLVRAFIDGDGKQDRKRKAHEQFAEAVHQRVADKIPEVIGLDEGLEVLESDPCASGDSRALEGDEVPESDLGIPDGDVLEDEVIDDREEQHDINELVPVDLSTKSLVLSLSQILFLLLEFSCDRILFGFVTCFQLLLELIDFKRQCIVSSTTIAIRYPPGRLSPFRVSTF